MHIEVADLQKRLVEKVRIILLFDIFLRRISL
jgi:hypothetical protein